MGIEPTYPAWKAGVLPLNYTRKIGVTGFEPATSWSQTRRSSQTEPHPVIILKPWTRSDAIRTRDLYVPNVALYQTEPHSDITNIALEKRNRMLFYIHIRRPCQGTTGKGLEPLLTESESAVLPITPSRINFVSQRTNIIILISKIKSTLFLIIFIFFLPLFSRIMIY